MLNSGKIILRSLLLISLVLVLAGGCATMQSQEQTTAKLQVSDMNCSAQPAPLAAGDALGYRVVANHPITVARRNSRLAIAARSNVANY